MGMAMMTDCAICGLAIPLERHGRATCSERCEELLVKLTSVQKKLLAERYGDKGKAG